jgi:Ca2+-binding RTX toxin-like protein
MATVNGTPNDDVLAGTADTDAIAGNEGNDVLAGLDGDDGISGGPGNNVIIGGRGNDSLVGGDSDIFIWNNGDGSDFVDGSGGTDVQVVNGAPAAGDEFRVDADLGANAIFQRTNIGPFFIAMNNVETLDVRGLGGDDTFTVTDLRTTDTTEVIFRGGAGNDVLNAAAARTSIFAFGEDGNDTITGGLGNDLIDGGTGVDTIVYTGGIDTVRIELADIVLLPNRGTARAISGDGFLLLDFGGGNILDLQWQPGAFTAQTYLAAHLGTLVLL